VNFFLALLETTTTLLSFSKLTLTLLLGTTKFLTIDIVFIVVTAHWASIVSYRLGTGLLWPSKKHFHSVQCLTSTSPCEELWMKICFEDINLFVCGLYVPYSLPTKFAGILI
jgi:hypothetical protein